MEPLAESALDWEQFVESYYQRIFGFCLHFLGNYAEAEDAVQDVFMRCYQSFGTLRDTQKARSWIYSIARNCCIDRKRWYKRFSSYLKARDRGAIVAPQSELSRTLRQLVSRLPRSQREIFILRHWHDFSTADTAEYLGVSEGTVKTQLKRAVDKIKAELNETI